MRRCFFFFWWESLRLDFCCHSFSWARAICNKKAPHKKMLIRKALRTTCVILTQFFITNTSEEREAHGGKRPRLWYDYVFHAVVFLYAESSKTVDISLATYHMTLSWDYFRNAECACASKRGERRRDGNDLILWHRRFCESANEHRQK